MKIAEIADVLVSIPPAKYGGTEYVISAITEGLVEREHDVSLFATGDSDTTAKLIANSPAALGFHLPNYDAQIRRVSQLVKIALESHTFDILHNHLFESFALLPYLKAPMVTTLHANPSDPGTKQVVSMPELKESFFIAVSDSQRRLLPELQYVTTIHHGVDISQFPERTKPDDYLLFLGRISPEKGPEIAVEVAKRTGRRLVVAAKYDNPPSKYVKKILKLFEETPEVEFIGEVSAKEKKELYANAHAFLMPIQWEEPFGLVVIEALACGTPVIAFNRGAMPEIIEDGKSGFLVSNTEEMVEAIGHISRISPKECRLRVEKQFTLNKMVGEYEQAFADIIRGYKSNQQ